MAGGAISNNFQINPCVDSDTPKVVAKKKRSLPGNPDPGAEVIALSPTTLMATNRFVCEVCGKGFQRDQNLQLHRRGHNLPWKLRQRSSKEIRKRVYICPEKTCVHHDPSRALGDLTGIKKHFCRKHGEKKWKCEKCSKRYAVQSDWKAHSRTCGTREYKCDCGNIFSRRDSFITHRAFCDALAEEAARISAAEATVLPQNTNNKTSKGSMESLVMPSLVQGRSMVETVDQKFPTMFVPTLGSKAAPNCEELRLSLSDLHQITSSNWGANPYSDPFTSSSDLQQTNFGFQLNWVPSSNPMQQSVPSLYSTQHEHHSQSATASMSATALLHKAAQIGATSTAPSFLQRLGMNYNNSLELQTLEADQDGNNFQRMFNLNPLNPSFQTDIDQPLSPLKQFARLQSTEKVDLREGGVGGQTRDFLGVGFQSMCPPSIQGWI